jgi:predicted acyl esterase
MSRFTLCFVFLLGCNPDGTASFDVRESVQQLAVTHAVPGATLELLDEHGQTVQSAIADSLGSYLFRKVAPGSGYRIVSGWQRSGPLHVLTVDESLPKQSFYSGQQLKPGFNYITTRDGTTLSAYINLPGPADKGPYPTVVDYSGYSPSKPGAPIMQAEFLCDSLPILCDAPNDPAGLIAGLFGYAVVSVNIRGTGCSGGAYDYFETLQLLDGYDVIEAVSAQPWVLHHKVGMVGLSYPGISQLFVASVKPPSLASIAPLSVIGNSQTTVLPGGILNDGFAVEWVNEVIAGAKPYGQGWEESQVKKGDYQCQENQLLHGQLVDNVAEARTTKFYDPSIHDALNPTTFVDQIDVPVFLTGQWEDEQTGPFFFTLLDRFKNAPTTRFIVHNGVHPDGFAPDIISEWYAFLELFVAQRVPVDSKEVADFSPLLFQTIFQSGMRLDPSPWTMYGSYQDALAAWKAQPALRVLFESGAAPSEDLGAPRGTFDHEFSAFPPPEQQARRWYFQADGTLGDAAPTDAHAASKFTLDPAAGERGILADGANVWDLVPKYDWRQPAPGSAVIFESLPLSEDMVMLGSGSVDLWLNANVDDADLESNLSEIRPDGQEMYVQSGWLRASYRGLGPDSTELWPSPTYEEKDWAPLVPGQWTQVRLPIAGFQHIFRAGSRIRISVDTPGDSRAEWRFALKTFDAPAVYTIGHDADHPSSLALPLIPGIAVTTPLPPCPSLRAQQCRDHVAYLNTAAP